MIWSGGMAWIADFPDPSNFYYGILGCGGAVEGGWNWSWYCNEALDERGQARPTPWSSAGQGRGARRGLEGHLRRRDEGCALGADLQREALHLSIRTRLGGDADAVHRSDPYPGELRLHLREGHSSRGVNSPQPGPVPDAPNGDRLPTINERQSHERRQHNHTIHHASHPFRLEQRQRPVLHGEPGETIEFDPIDASGGQITPKSTVADVRQARFRQGQSGRRPVYVDGAEPGDAIKVTLLRFTPSGWGWTANIPGFGLLADQFKEPALHIWKYDAQADDAGRLRAGRPRAAEAVLRHHRPGAGRARPAQHRAAAPGRRQHGHPRHGRRHRALSAGRGGGRRCSRSATPTPPRATARSAAPPSRAHDRRGADSIW